MTAGVEAAGRRLKRLVLVCHGATSATRAVAFAAGEDLDARGLARARALSLRVTAKRCLSSPAAAALQTAAALGLEATVDPALRDLDCGCWAGRTLDAVAADDPAGLARWLDDPAAAPHDGESLLALRGRVAAWLDARSSGLTVAVTHAAVVKAAVLHALDAAPRSFWRLDAAPLAVATLQAAGPRWTLRALDHPPRPR